eukprot:761006-Hanusia_phi.AAC.1
MVNKVQPDSEACAKGVQEGDRIVQLEYDDVVEKVRQDGRHPKLLAGGPCRVTFVRVMRDMCGNCGATDMQVIEREGCVVCGSCGVVHRSSIREASFADFGPAGGEGGAKRKKVDFEEARDLKRANQKICQETDSYVVKMKELVNELGEKLAISEQVKQQAANLASSMPRKWDKDVVASASLYLACKELELSRSLREICAATGSVYSKVTNCVMHNSQGTKSQTYDQLLDRFLGYLDLPSSYVQEAVKLQAEKQLTGAPATIAAVMIYKVWEKRDPGKADRNKVAEACGVSSTTLKKRLSECCFNL